MKNKSNCEIKKCRYWIESNNSCNNCCINFISNKNEKITLEDIGKLFKVTRMRICQIEKIAIKKVKEKFSLTSF
tara:strand:- start:1956 stop:2177 length:222 start_codon:yes stop_codon:yes gene_type:complete